VFGCPIQGPQVEVNYVPRRLGFIVVVSAKISSTELVNCTGEHDAPLFDLAPTPVDIDEVARPFMYACAEWFRPAQEDRDW
jgi:hypothetical protein